MKKLKSIKPYKVRRFRALLGLSIITFGIYFMYWLYINLKEISNALTLSDHETITETANKMVVAYTITMVVTIITLCYAFPQPIKIQHHLLFLVLLIGGGIRALFFYYFTAVISVGQKKAKLTSSKILSVYYYYVIGLIMTFVGNIMLVHVISLIGVILIWFYIYKIQKQINKIWVEGKFNNIHRDTPTF